MSLQNWIAEYNKYLKAFYLSVDNSSFPHLLGWASKSSQVERFRVFKDIIIKKWGNTQDVSLIDIGCGYGELYRYLYNEDSFPFHYTGIDISKKYITICKSSYPDANFFVHDILEYGKTPKQLKKEIGSYNIACMSGVLNFNLDRVIKVDNANMEILKFVLDKLYAITDGCVVCNFLHNKTSQKQNFFCYYNPQELIENLNSMGYKVQEYYENYLPNDFTIVITH